MDGRDISTIKIDSLEVMTEDLGIMTWDEAVKACEDAGDGWRLPTKGELNFLYDNKDDIGGFETEYYWSDAELTEKGDGWIDAELNSDNTGAWIQFFDHGDQYIMQKYDEGHVRAVRSI